MKIGDEEMSNLVKIDDVLECIEDAQDGSKGTYDILADVFNRVLALPSAEATQNMKAWNGLYIKVYADDDPQDKAEKLYQICDSNEALSEVAKCIQGYLDEPSAEAVEVVRCSDCNWHLNGHLCKQLSQYGSIETPPNFYCGFGERRE